ncbi:DUF4123 domain-containing protein [Pseudomonas sp. CCI3.2]|uniref:DUF4123 domain-containing protein n=1 Tax=unclassified Pseudomonas TaxID=196821 RepID=UPI002AC95712|nr:MULTISPECIES: DUF4123 domain-containing protein [unclassified Pseudomonas]MEB0079629.1 DUF4123 domain-containing protein [Pseudomonas sp. MH10out]MEB0103835.1 DUF4123 domain-containing protein [Pseudomonas sp. CCI3.2]MEB0133085.1 DUF4123 domain-containing protein [Pseudomonas sp. CCI2.4]MEB0157810.1 DUF4123 domain-containing protein [Pseudomonas sp. AH2 (2023)]MEB0169343.1 DUF4123 domain-containing protein [Pseudomonas sp. CCC4.4]
MTIQPNSWMAEQSRLARSTYLILNSDGEQETRQAFLAVEQTPEYISVYAQTPISDMVTGPLILKISSPMRPLLTSLFETPERNWGWLVSCKGDHLAAMANHWRARIIIGQRPEQSLYRFHDNRVLARALNHLNAEALPEYLGPIASVLYWNGQEWAVGENPSPGVYPVPVNPAWLSVPVPAARSRAILHANIGRHLLEDHTEAIVDLAESVNTSHWITEQLDLADDWGWTTPEQLEFLITQRLKEEKVKNIKSWLPLSGETSQVHFERIYKEAKSWSGGA